MVGRILLDSLMIFAGRQPWPSMEDEVALHQLIEARGRGGDVRAQRIMAGLCERKALADSNPRLLDEAERWYHLATAQGDSEAEHFLSNVWPKHKQHLLSWIEGKDKD